jgi:hypothetical protein
MSQAMERPSQDHHAAFIIEVLRGIEDFSSQQIHDAIFGSLTAAEIQTGKLCGSSSCYMEVKRPWSWLSDARNTRTKRVQAALSERWKFWENKYYVQPHNFVVVV